MLFIALHSSLSLGGLVDLKAEPAPWIVDMSVVLSLRWKVFHLNELAPELETLNFDRTLWRQDTIQSFNL